ncbi:hypothetical protein [Mycoplasma bradburyae]|uniref:hypothetical protein n=1 Tax=Mycoplasma bradburyae TaxID=2963128 RepID=UPI0020CBE97C|nr:hypothetical protein [Mycoplasma bradburyae]UTS70565.1 hypothetical protein NMG77_02310 [Mycoplasma bradburyae]
MRIFRKFGFSFNLLGSCLTLVIPSLLLSSCSKQQINSPIEEVPTIYKDLVKEPINVEIKKQDLKNTEWEGADKNDVLINLSDNKLVLRKKFSEKDIQVLRDFLSYFKDKTSNEEYLHSNERYLFSFVSSNKDALSDWKTTTNENQIFLSEKMEEEKLIKNLVLIIRSVEYENLNNLLTLNNNKANLIQVNSPKNKNITLFRSTQNEKSLLQFSIGFSSENEKLPISINDNDRSIIFNNLFLGKILFRDEEKMKFSFNWSVNLGKFTLLNAF